MRAVVQRVRSALVRVDGDVVGSVGAGLVAFVCAMRGDTDADERWLAQRVAQLRVFPDAAGKMHEDLVQFAARSGGGGLLVVSQFTLSALVQPGNFPGHVKGNRPSFTEAAPPAEASAAVDRLVAGWRRSLLGVEVATGRFGADMQVLVENDGPVTLWLDSRRPVWATQEQA